MDNYLVFPKEYLEKNQEKYQKEKQLFSKYLNFTHSYVNSIQCNSTSPKEENILSFYPIAKNIRFTSSYMTNSILQKKASFLDNKTRNSEPEWWRNHLNMGNWYPWLWARERNELSGNFSNKEGWGYYFTSFLPQQQSIPISSKENNPQPPPEHLCIFFIYLSCLRYTFQFNMNYQQILSDYKTQMNWPDSSRILAMHIRRGDSCTSDGSITVRQFFTLEQYLEKADKMCSEVGYEYIYISTDSNEEIEKMKQARPEWKLLFLPIDRSQFYRMKDKTVDIEVACCLEPHRIPFTVDTGLADLFFISQCQGYISTISISEFSRCGWFLQMAEQEHITPYINMNDEILDMNMRDKLLLL
jgi:hypothetical protein